MRTKWYIYTRLQQYSQPSNRSQEDISNTKHTIQQEIMSVSPPLPNNKFHAIHANFAKHLKAPSIPPTSDFPPTHQQAPFPSSRHALQILPHTFLLANWIPFFAPYPYSLYLFLSLSNIASFLALVLGNKFLRSLTAFRFSWETDFQGSFPSCFFPSLSLSHSVFPSCYFLFFCLPIRFLCQLQVLSKCK